MSGIPHLLEDQIADLYTRIAEIERRSQNAKRTGTIAEVDAAKGLAKVQLKDKGDDGKPYISGWLPWGEIAAGKISTHIPPSVDQQVKVVSESGDLSDAEIDMSIPSNANPRPHDKEGEGVISVGDTRIFFSASETRITSPKIVLEGEVHLGGDGGQLVHRKGDVDSAGDLATGAASKVYAL
ncbi:MAG: phage baseplate assembly protein V [Hyphomicrobiaceae bacterium]|nr:phage baseplate assembly protein V [Hyphomicrobiaceae bacterium]